MNALQLLAPLAIKARNVPYVDAEEEEWAKFQKEIGEELQTAQVILVEDREEANADRQIEEIDEQMAAWSRLDGYNDVFFFCGLHAFPVSVLRFFRFGQGGQDGAEEG